MNAEIPRSAPSGTTRFPTFRRLPGQLKKGTVNGLRAALRLPGRTWRLFRRVFLSRRSAVVYAVGGTAVCLAYASCNWYWRRAWEQEKALITASGGSLDLRQLVEPPPPEEENFYATPLLKKLFTEPQEQSVRLKMWFNTPGIVKVTGRNGKPYSKTILSPRGNGDTLVNWCAWFQALGTLPAPAGGPAPSAAGQLLADHRYDDLFEELRKAARRPRSRMLTTLAEGDSDQRSPWGKKGDWGHYESYSNRTFRDLIAAIRLRSRAWIAVNNPSEALEDLAVLRKMTDGLLAENAFTATGMGSAFLNLDLGGLLREGMRNHAWSDGILTELLRRDDRPRMLQAWRKTCEAMRAIGAQQLENHASVFPGHEKDYGARWYEYPLIRAYPDGLWMRACIRQARYNAALMEAAAPLAKGESWASRAEPLRAILPPRVPVFSALSDRWSAGETLMSWIAHFAVGQEISRTAIRLERHWIKHRRYPAALAELDPAPSEGIPLGIDGDPLHYQTNPEGSTFRLWSPRWPKNHPNHGDRDILLFANE